MVRKSQTPRLSPRAEETSVFGTFSYIISIFELFYDLSPMGYDEGLGLWRLVEITLEKVKLNKFNFNY